MSSEPSPEPTLYEVLRAGAVQERGAASREPEGLMDEHRPGWRTLPPDEIEQAMKDVATSLGAPDGSPEIARAAHDLAVRQEATNLATFLAQKLDAAEGPGIERPVQSEVRERIFIDAIEERYGGMTPLAAEVCKLLGFEQMAYEPREDRLLN